jgi:hypothetical protein
MSACPILAKEQCVKRYDRANAQTLFNMFKEIGLNRTKNSGMSV